MPLPDTPWNLQFDRRFVEEYEDLEGSGFQDRVRSMVAKIAQNPLAGEPKTGVLKGTRTTHIEHLVIQWELEPEIHRREHLDDLEKVYFLNLTHHDDMVNIGRRGPTETGAIEFRIEFDDWEVGAIISAIHGLEGTSDVDENWSSGPPVVTGKIDRDNRQRLLEIIPDSASISFESRSPF